MPTAPDPPADPLTVRRYLLPTETCVVAVRRHWAMVIRPVFRTAAGIAFLILLARYLPAEHLAVRFGVWPLGAALSLWCTGHVLNRRSDYFIVTDKRIMLTSGLLGRRVSMMPLSKVTDMSYHRSPAGRLLGHGTFVMESAGQEQPLREVTYVPSPDTVYLKVCDQLFGPTGG